MSNDKSKTIVENIELAGGQLVDKVKELFEESNARKVIIRNSDGDELLTIPLTLGIVGGGVLALGPGILPVIAAVGALAAVVNKVKLEVIREVDADAVVESDDADSADSSKSA